MAMKWHRQEKGCLGDQEKDVAAFWRRIGLNIDQRHGERHVIG